MLIVLFVCGYGGFALLALSQAKNWRIVRGGPPLSGRATVAIRCLGYAMLGLGLVPALWSQGPGIGAVLWAVSLSFCAVAVALTLSWRSARIRQR